MSFAIVKAYLEKEGESLLYELRKELSKDLVVFKYHSSESYYEEIIKMKQNLIIAEAVALCHQIEREGKPIGDTSLWYHDYLNYINLKAKYLNHQDKFVYKEYIKDFRDEIKDNKSNLVETAPSWTVRPDLKSIVNIFELVKIDMEFDEDMYFDVKRFLKRYEMYQDMVSVGSLDGN